MAYLQNKFTLNLIFFLLLKLLTEYYDFYNSSSDTFILAVYVFKLFNLKLFLN